MRSKIKRSRCYRARQGVGLAAALDGSTLVLAILAMVILSALGVGMLATAYGVRHRAIQLKNETTAMLAAEAGYEKAIYWMGQQKDMLSALQEEAAGTKSTLSFSDSSCNYQIKLFSFIGSRPVYRVISNGRSGIFNKTVEVYVVQALSGWDMGKCRVPTGPSSTTELYFVDKEIIDMPLFINDFKDSPDYRDINIKGQPQFKERVAMGESKYRSGSIDKPGYSDSRDYDDLMYLFEDGIYFDQPDSRITDESAIQSKVDRFKNSTDTSYRFTPTAYTGGSWSRYPAVQLEFFVDGGVGKVRITNNCTVRATTAGTYDYRVVPGSSGSRFEKYNIYAYHYKPTSQASVIVPLTETYVTQSFGSVQSEPGGQIFVDGSVVIGSSDYTNMAVKGKMTIVATGNIWVADSILLDGTRDENGMPATCNPNIFGLITQGVVKVINPTSSTPSPPSGLTYQPIGITKTGYSGRFLPDPTVVEAAITVGGGGWGAENVGNRREYSGSQDDLIVRGSIVEVIRGAVGLTGFNPDGYKKYYYLDERLLEGILPGDIWMRGKYIPAPAGWHDYRL